MHKINVVYAYMKEPRYTVELPSAHAYVVWTREEERGSDVVIYYSGYSFNRKRTLENPDAFRILYIYEPSVVYPRHFMKGFWDPFDRIFTFNDELLKQGGAFVRFPVLCYDFPFGAVHGIIQKALIPADWRERPRAMCQIAGNKRTLMNYELYSLRRKAARWFYHHGKTPFDLYGIPAMRIPSHHGAVDDKIRTMGAYRYCFCTENSNHPLWAQGYVTEKMLDALYAFCVPVYLGAPNIEHLIPKACYIDLRDFDSFKALDEYLYSMSDDKYFSRLQAIEQFLKSMNPADYSCHALYEKALKEALSRPQPSSGCKASRYGFWQRASFFEKVRYLIMMGALWVYKCLVPTRYSGA